MIFDKYPQIIWAISKIPDGNMSIKYGDVKKVLANRKKFFQRLGIKNVVEVTHVDDNKVLIVSDDINPQTEADSLITDKKDVYLMIKPADCMAIGFYDPKHNAIGLTHAGSKGLKTDIIKNTVLEMTNSFKTSPKNLIVKISPSIGPCHYQINIWKEAENQLVKSGILKENIDNPKICTYESSDYFSHRRSEDTNTPEGRFVTILGLKNVN